MVLKIYIFSSIIDEATFLPIPPLQLAIITACIIFLSSFLNFFVLRFYWRVKDSTRPYILSLVALDSVAILFTLLPVSVVYCLEVKNLASVIVLQLSFQCARYTFILYLYPSLFLALDRFLAVWFPHKFRILSPKFKKVKIFLVILTFVLVTINGSLQALNAHGSVLNAVAGLLNLSLIVLQLVGSIVLYSLTAHRIFKSSRAMAANKHTTSERNG